ncbi:MAG: hypothetical protein ABJB74_23425 [Gemmatimonas sp.]
MTTLATISTRFATQLRELTEAIERGEVTEHRIRVLHEYAKTWMMLAEGTQRLAVVRAGALGGRHD